MLITSFDSRMDDLFDPAEKLEAISVGHQVTEGIIWHPQRKRLVFSDMGAGRVYEWNPETFETKVIKAPSNISNGNFIDNEGRIVTCEHATSSITRMEHDPRLVKTLVSHYQGKELNSPNDVIVDSKGNIWFSDPMYGRTSPRAGIKRESELGFQGIYCLRTDGTLVLACKDFENPNGLCMEPGEKTMLVNDTPRKHVRRFKVEDDCTLSGGEIICTVKGEGLGSPDGLKIDDRNNIYCTGPGGVHVFDKNGKQLGIINMPGWCRNFCFGGEDMSEMFFATETIYRLRTKTHGAKRG